MKLEMEKIYKVPSAPLFSHHMLIKHHTSLTVLSGFKYSSHRISVSHGRLFHLPAVLICLKGASGDLLQHLTLCQTHRGYACSTACLICHYVSYISLQHPSDI